MLQDVIKSPLENDLDIIIRQGHEGNFREIMREARKNKVTNLILGKSIKLSYLSLSKSDILFK